ncbi:MAG: ABC transporter ATP-binding protein [Candidatus Lokiarchaeota archaeon]|nr:ABC transporter ATP-binding protein [Candidatus Lokiarchaeota archaeon]
MVNIILEKVNKIFSPDVHVLKDIDLEIQDKEFLVLVGPSGCGKSTCLNIIAGLEYVTNGRILFNNIDVSYLPPKERKVAMVFQSYALYPHMNVRDNMSFSLKLSKTDKRIIDKRVKVAAEILGISELLERKPKELSGGQRQRVALGRCMVRNPTAFLFDEPLSNLDAKLRTQMRGEIIKLQKRLGITLVYVTHDQVEAMSMADRIAILFDGRIQQLGTPSEVYNCPTNLFVAGFIGSPTMNFIDTKFDQKNRNMLIFGEQKYPLPEDIANKLVKASFENLILGIRPEHIKVTTQTHQDSYEVEITVIEYLGAETIITFEFPDKISAMAVTPGFYPGRMGDIAYISFSPDQIHIFDSETEMNLIHFPS